MPAENAMIELGDDDRLPQENRATVGRLGDGRRPYLIRKALGAVSTVPPTWNST
jgi:hypothetical protein